MIQAFKVIVVNLGLLTVFAIVIELTFGAWIYAPGLWTLSIQRDFRIHRWTLEKYLRDNPLTYSRDYFGFRGNHHPPEAINIIAIGGSTTDEPDVSDEETWVAGLETCLNQRNVQAKIVNAGINGQSTLGHIRNFDVWFSRIPRLKPKFVLAMIGINEDKILRGPEQNRPSDDVTFRDKEGEPNQRYGYGTMQRFATIDLVRDWIQLNSAFFSLYRIAKVICGQLSWEPTLDGAPNSIMTNIG